MPTYSVTITDAQQLCLDNDLLSVQDWIQGAIDGKINNCKKRFVKSAFEELKKDPTVTSIPADDDGIISLITSKPGYKNRVKREAEST